MFVLSLLLRCIKLDVQIYFKSARELSAVTWGQELAIALRRCNASLSNDGDDIDLIKANNPQMLSFGVKVKSALRDVWEDATTDVFSVGYVHHYVPIAV